MMNTPMANELSQHWVTVVDELGRERLESRWVDLALMVQTSHAA